MKGGGSREPLPFLCRSSFLPLFFPIPSEKPIAFWRWAFPFPAGESPWTMRYGLPRYHNSCITKGHSAGSALFPWCFKLEFIEENGLPHQCAHWFAMTVFFGTFRTIFSAVNHQASMSLRGGMKCRRGNPFLQTKRQTVI